jgi:hypothetical protein
VSVCIFGAEQERFGRRKGAKRKEMAATIAQLVEKIRSGEDDGALFDYLESLSWNDLRSMKGELKRRRRKKKKKKKKKKEDRISLLSL